MLLTQHQLNDIATFLNYTFTNVLRLQKCHVAFDPTTTHNCYYIVPTLRGCKNQTIYGEKIHKMCLIYFRCKWINRY
jgi:hypothetical protein